MKDLIIVGGGPGGYHAAIKGAQCGMKTTLIEMNKLGGICLNEGCIPTKSLIHSAEIFQTVKNAENLGIHVKEYSVDWEKIQEKKDSTIKKLSEGLEQLIKSNKVETIIGKAKITETEPPQVDVYMDNKKSTSVTGRNLILATGSQPITPPLPGKDLPGVIGSSEALKLPDIPDRLTIVGGGVIGAEFASIYSKFGCKVTIIELLPSILSNMDEEIARRIETEFKRQGIKVLTGAELMNMEETAEGIAAHIEHRKKHKVIKGDKVLMAAGRRPKIANISNEYILENLVKENVIRVNEYMESSLPGIYAVGDVNGKYMLAHTASAEALTAVDNIIGKRRAMNYRAVPDVAYTLPEAAGVGLTEQECKTQGLDYKTTKFMFAANSRAVILGESRGIVKLITSARKGKIIGGHILGPNAGELIHELALAVEHEITAEEVAHTIHAHPTLSEAIMEAAQGVNEKFIHMLS